MEAASFIIVEGEQMAAVIEQEQPSDDSNSEQSQPEIDVEDKHEIGHSD